MSQNSIKQPLTVARNQHEGNQAILEENREHYSNQTQTVLNHLLNGESVSGARMYDLHRIQDIRPRIAAIKKLGYELEETKISNGKGAKSWRIK